MIRRYSWELISSGINVHSDWVNGVCSDGHVISLSCDPVHCNYTINEHHQRIVSINSVTTATLLFRYADSYMVVWLPAALVLGIAADGLLTDSEQGFPMKDLQTQFSMTQLHRSRQQLFEKRTIFLISHWFPKCAPRISGYFEVHIYLSYRNNILLKIVQELL